MESIAALVGVALGWGLKTLTDYITSRKADSRTFRKATFYVLKTYKALFDYERGTVYFRQQRPPIEEFEPWRATLEARFLEESEANSDPVSTAIDLLASVDPTLAIRIHNSLRNLEFAFRKNLTAVAETDEEVYAELVYTQDELVDFTLEELEDAALHLAGKAGLFQKSRVNTWLEERKQGTAEFVEGMDDTKGIRDRAADIT